MSFSDSINAFVDGLKSVVDVSGAVQAMLAGALTRGIESGFQKIKKPIEAFVLKLALTIISVLFIFFGLALFIDQFMPYRGLGFLIVGIFFSIVFLLTRKRVELNFN